MPAGFNIENFKAHTLRNGFSRANKFMVRIPMPFGMNSQPDSTQNIETLRQIEFWGEATTLPGVTISAHRAYRYGYGHPEHRPMSPVFTEVPIMFLADGKGEILSFFQRWIKMIVNYDMRKGIINNDVRTGSVRGLTLQPFELAYRYEYITDVNITMFNERGITIAKTVLREAFPIQVGDVGLNWGDNQNIARIPVVFAYTDWYSEMVSPTPNPTPYNHPTWVDPWQTNQSSNTVPITPNVLPTPSPQGEVTVPGSSE